MTAFFFGDRIIAAFAPGMTAYYAFQTQVCAIEKAMYFEGLSKIRGAGRFKTASSRGEWGYTHLIASN